MALREVEHELGRSLCDLCASGVRTAGKQAHVPAPVWGTRYFERQQGAFCGRRALNNVLGGPHFVDDNLIAAATMVCSEINEPMSWHAKQTGWYSHGVLCKAFGLLVPTAWRLLSRPLNIADVQEFQTNPLIVGAICNEGNVQWTPVVEHEEEVWYVDSRAQPQLLRAGELEAQSRHNPMTFEFVH